MNPRISVIMSVYQESIEQIIPAIDSIVTQSFPDWELIVMVDDPQNETAIAYLHKRSTTDRRIKLYVNEENLGLGASLNAAVSYASAPLLARMDTEDISHPNRLIEQMTYMIAHPTTDLLFTQWQEQDENGVITKRLPSKDDAAHITKNFFLKSILLHPTMMVRRQVLIDHPYPAMGRPEDWVLFLKLMRLGYQFRLLEKVLYTYQTDRREKYTKVRAYASNLLPHLFRNIPFYWHNVYFWIYVARVSVEWLISRNEYLFNTTNSTLKKIYHFISGTK